MSVERVAVPVSRLSALWAWLAAAFAIVVWSVTFASTRVLLRHYSSLEIMVFRLVIAWTVLRGIAVFGRRRCAAGAFCRRASWRDEFLFAGMGLTGVAAYHLLENCAVFYTNASNVAILTSFAPIATALLARIVKKDGSFTPTFVAGSAVAICGVAMVSLDGVAELSLHPLGDFMALASMASWGVYSVLLDTANERGHSQMFVMERAMFWAIVAMAPFVLWGMTDEGGRALDGSFRMVLGARENMERLERPENWCNIGFLGVVASAASFVLWNHACRVLGVVRVSAWLYLTPVAGVVFAVLLLRERLTAVSVLGGVVTTLGAAFAVTCSRFPRRNMLE
jgi:drug/metabolite transporter (DMT)-like permease